MMQEFVQRIKDCVSEALQDIHTSLPAEIVSVDAKNGLATVLPKAKMELEDGSLVAYPQISGVPIVMPQGAGQFAEIAFPVKKGDGCLLIISEQSLEYWLYGRETDTSLPFDLSNAICIPGLFHKLSSSFAEACSSNSVIVSVNGTKLKVGQSGVSVKGSMSISGNLNVSGHIYGHFCL